MLHLHLFEFLYLRHSRSSVGVTFWATLQTKIEGPQSGETRKSLCTHNTVFRCFIFAAWCNSSYVKVVVKGMCTNLTLSLPDIPSHKHIKRWGDRHEPQIQKNDNMSILLKWENVIKENIISFTKSINWIIKMLKINLKNWQKFLIFLCTDFCMLLSTNIAGVFVYRLCVPLPQWFRVTLWRPILDTLQFMLMSRRVWPNHSAAREIKRHRGVWGCKI